jgi:hypothetical protein
MQLSQSQIFAKNAPREFESLRPRPPGFGTGILVPESALILEQNQSKRALAERI